MRCLALLVYLYYISSLVAQAQEFNVEKEQFPGAKRVKVKSFRGSSGFWAEYKLDGQGWATEGRNYYRRKLNKSEYYAFTNRRKLYQEKIITFGETGRIQYFNYSYQYNSDSSRIIRKVGLSGTDTMYVFHFLEFDQNNRPTRFTKGKGWSSKATEVTELTYTNSQVATYHRTDYTEEGAIVYTVTYQYNRHGDLTKESRSISPKPPATFWIDGQGDESEYDYEYSPQGFWTRQYAVGAGRKVLIAKRTITY